MTNTISPAEFAELTWREVTTGTLDQKRVTQLPHEHGPTSLGVKLHRALADDGVAFNSEIVGLGLACRMLGCTRDGLSRLLFFCGAPKFPLSRQNKQWPTSRFTVWERLGLLGVMPRFGSHRIPDMIMSVASANDSHWRNTYGLEFYRLRFPETRSDFWRVLKEGILCSTEMRNFNRYRFIPQPFPLPPKPKRVNT